MNQPDNVNLEEWQVYADYCFDYKPQEEQRARYIIKAIENDKTKLYLYFYERPSGLHEYSSQDFLLSSISNSEYSWREFSNRTDPFCPFDFKKVFKKFPHIIAKYFDKLTEMGELIDIDKQIEILPKCNQFMYSCGENLTTLEKLLELGCDNCKAFAKLKLKEEKLTGCTKKGE